MQFPIDWLNETDIARAFRYATRTKIGVRVGSRPIGWYQRHQCHALDVLEAHARQVLDLPKPNPVLIRYRKGVFQARAFHGHTADVTKSIWRTLTTAHDIYRRADDLARR